MSRRGLLAAGAGVAATGALLARRAKRVTAYPPGPDAITAEGARAHVESLAEKAALSRTDLAMTFAPAIATSVEPLLHGHRYFPRMLEDIDAARDHMHLLIYGYKPGDIGTTFLERLAAKVARGRRGPARRSTRSAARSTWAARTCSRDLHRRRDQGRRPRWHVRRAAADRWVPALGLQLEDTLHFDHRKMAVIDGRIALRRRQRHRGPLQRRALLRRHVPGDRPGRRPAPARLPRELAATRAGRVPAERCARWFPPDVLVVPTTARLRVPTTILWNVPGTGHHPISDAIEASHRGRPRADRHRQPVHQQPGDPRAPARRRPARRGSPAHRSRQADAALPGRGVPAPVSAAHGGRRRDPAPPRDGPRQGPSDRRPGAHRRLQPR